MRIAYIHYICEGDTALHHVRQFTAAARDLGHRVDVHAVNLAGAADDGKVSGTNLSRRIRGTLKRRFSRYLHEPKELLWNLRYVALETRILRAQRPDVVLVRDHALTASCVPVARRVDLPLVLEVNAPVEELELYYDQYFHLPAVPRWLEAWKLRQADAVTAVSSALAEHLANRHGLPQDRIVVVPNGADTGRFHPRIAVGPEVGPELGGRAVVGFIGSFQKFHGPELLTELIRQVGAARPEVRFLLVGDGPEAGLVRSSTQHLGDRVRFHGRVDHERVPGLVAAFDVAVMPESNFYGSPLKVIEWMAAGRAVVAPGYGPLQEVIESGRHGLLFPPRDVEALVAAVLRLVDDPELRHKLGESAASRVGSSLTWAHNARQVVAACEQALERRRVRRLSGARRLRSDGRSR